MSSSQRQDAAQDGRHESEVPHRRFHGTRFGEYATDCWQRNVLFWDVMRRRSNQYLEHAAKPVQLVFRYDFEKVIDGRELARPVNYGLVCILPPAGVEIDNSKRPV